MRSFANGNGPNTSNGPAFVDRYSGNPLTLAHWWLWLDR